jgi:hypothetical protein
MAIQPIDLQTLFTQLEKVAKTQSAQKEGLAIQQTMQGIENQKKTEEHIQEISEAREEGEGERVNDQNRRKQREGPDGEKRKNGEAEEDGEERAVIRDPTLGRNVDISG